MTMRSHRIAGSTTSHGVTELFVVDRHGNDWECTGTAYYEGKHYEEFQMATASMCAGGDTAGGIISDAKWHALEELCNDQYIQNIREGAPE